jgi:hypothetical protein
VNPSTLVFSLALFSLGLLLGACAVRPGPSAAVYRGTPAEATGLAETARLFDLLPAMEKYREGLLAKAKEAAKDAPGLAETSHSRSAIPLSVHPVLLTTCPESPDDEAIGGPAYQVCLDRGHNVPVDRLLLLPECARDLHDQLGAAMARVAATIPELPPYEA